MENYIETTELINKYLNNTLSKTERQNFKNRLETDSEFKALFNEHLALLEGINRVNLKAEINVAKQNYVRGKWAKYIKVLVGVVLVSVLVYSFIFRTEIPKVLIPINNQTESVSEFKIIEKPSKEVIEVSVENIEKEDEIATPQKVARNDVSIEKGVSKEKTLTKPEEISQNLKSESINPELIAFFKSNKKAPQIIELYTEKDFTVTCKEGTVLTIPANSFVDAKTGQLAKGKINLEVTEYYKLSDMLLTNLTTKADENQLETGGMLYLDANQNGQELKLKENIVLKFPNKNNKIGMQLFIGEENEDAVNWKLRSNQIVNNITVDSSLTIFGQTSGDIVDRSLWIKEIMLDSTLVVSDELQKAFIKFRDQKLIREIGILSDRKVIIRKPLLDMENSPFKIQLEDSVTRGGHVIRKPLELSFKRFSRALIVGVPLANEDKYNVFETSKLGWINCDRFVRSNKRKIRYKLKIKNADEADVKMVFKSVSSILPSKKHNNDYDFGKIPLDEDVKIIAIKEKDGKYFLSIKDTKIKVSPKLDLEFEEVTIQELKESLEKLNSNF